MKKNKGITLIALIITIIVLLILAGISIATLTGENGILTKSNTSKEQTEQAKAKERIQVEVLGSMGNDGKVELEKLKTNIGINIPEGAISGEEFPITVTIEGKIFKIEENGNVKENGSEEAKAIEAGEIANNEETFKKVVGGKVLNYGTDEEIEWKVFYADNNGIYLISSDYIPVSKLASQKTSLGFSDNSKYNIYWSSSSDFKVTETNDAIASKFMLNEKAKFTASNPSYKMTASLLETESWETLRDERWAEANNVIGGSTLEMYIASWNKKYPANKLYTNTNSNGYYVGTRKNPTTFYINISSTVGYQDVLYYPHREFWGKCNGYWLASPSADEADDEMYISCDGGVKRNSHADASMGIRPLVHLKYGVKVKPQGNDFVLE